MVCEHVSWELSLLAKDSSLAAALEVAPPESDVKLERVIDVCLFYQARSLGQGICAAIILFLDNTYL